MNKKILTLFLLLCACNTFPVKPSEEQLTIAKTYPNKELFEMGNRAMIILQVKNSYNLENYLTFINTNTKESYKFYIDSGTSAVYMLPPGIYELNNFYLYKKVVNGNYTKISSIDLSDIVSAKFSIKAGEAVYLGNIDIQLNSGKKISNNWFSGKSKTQTNVNISVGDNLNSINRTKIDYINKNTNNKVIETKLIEINK